MRELDWSYTFTIKPMIDRRKLVITLLALCVVLAIATVIFIKMPQWRGLTWLDEYTPTEAHTVGVYPELSLPQMSYTGIWGHLDRNADIFRYDPITGTTDSWKPWLQKLQAAGWQLITDQGNEAYLRKISGREGSRMITEVRAGRANNGTIVVAMVERGVDDNIAGLESTSVGPWLQDSFWPRFRKIFQDIDRGQSGNRVISTQTTE